MKQINIVWKTDYCEMAFFYNFVSTRN